MLPVHTQKLTLASTSVYRQELLSRLGLAFDTKPPGVNEDRLLGESPLALSRRLALAKAQCVFAQHPDRIVIGADQVLDVGGQALGKPGSIPAAIEQLRALSGKVAYFHSAVTVIGPSGTLLAVETSIARFRQLDRRQIEHYVHIETPIDTAGSAKAEGLGIALLEELSSKDPTAIIGLPLITLTRMLRLNGLDPLTHA